MNRKAHKSDVSGTIFASTKSSRKELAREQRMADAEKYLNRLFKPYHRFKDYTDGLVTSGRV